VTDYEAWRPALIAFLKKDSPWMVQKLANLKRGDPLTFEDRRIIETLILAEAA
jgi:hypothetical protein